MSQLLRVTIGKNAKNWLDCLPFIEFAYNRANHSSTKFSPFEIVYGFNPGTPMDLSPLPPTEVTSLDGEAKAEAVKKLHQKVKENLEKRSAQIKAHVDKRRSEMIYEPGDWVWLHMRPERFPKQRKSKLDPRGDGPFRVLERINNNAYKLELPDEVKISHTFNVSDLSPFALDEGNLGEEDLEEGGNDEDIKSLTQLPIPDMKELPRTRQGTRRLREQLEQSMSTLLRIVDRSPTKEEWPNFGELIEEEFGSDQEHKGHEEMAQEEINSSPSPKIELNTHELGQVDKILFVINSKAPPLHD